MKLILGVDIGTSATKIAGLKTDGTVLSTLRVDTPAGPAGFVGAVREYLAQNHLSEADILQAALTGVGASSARQDGCPISLHATDEFTAVATGALRLSGLDSAVITSLGTGTAFLWADRQGNLRHLCGSGVGGGTLAGLCHHLAGTECFGQIEDLLRTGDVSKVDLAIRDVCLQPPESLDPGMTASNFAKTSDAHPADLAAGAMNLVLEAIGTMTVLACQACQAETVVLTGSLVQLPQARAKFQVFERLYGMRYIIPEHAAFVTAIGAAMLSMPQSPQ